MTQSWEENFEKQSLGDGYQFPRLVCSLPTANTGLGGSEISPNLLSLHLVSWIVHEYSQQGSCIFLFPILECIGTSQENRPTQQFTLWRTFLLNPYEGLCSKILNSDSE